MEDIRIRCSGEVEFCSTPYPFVDCLILVLPCWTVEHVAVREGQGLTASERPSLMRGSCKILLPWILKFHHMSRLLPYMLPQIIQVKAPKRPDSVPSQYCFSCPLHRCCHRQVRESTRAKEKEPEREPQTERETSERERERNTQTLSLTQKARLRKWEIYMISSLSFILFIAI